MRWDHRYGEGTKVKTKSHERGHIYLEFSSDSGYTAVSLNVLTQFIEQYWYIWDAVFIIVRLAIALLCNNAFVNIVIL